MHFKLTSPWSPVMTKHTEQSLPRPLYGHSLRCTPLSRALSLAPGSLRPLEAWDVLLQTPASSDPTSALPEGKCALNQPFRAALPTWPSHSTILLTRNKLRFLSIHSRSGELTSSAQLSVSPRRSSVPYTEGFYFRYFPRYLITYGFYWLNWEFERPIRWVFNSCIFGLFY